MVLLNFIYHSAVLLLGVVRYYQQSLLLLSLLSLIGLTNCLSPPKLHSFTSDLSLELKMFHGL